ncbi:MAG: DNA adenine methylase [Anaerolineaceae bacterium]
MIRYPGGKWKMAPWIIDHFPKHEVYVEVFGGGASVLLRKFPSRTEIYNDIDSDIVNIFRVMRDSGKANKLEQLLRWTPFSSEEYEDCFVPGIDDIDRARKMIARSFFGIGSDSIFRKNGFRRGFKNKKLDANNAFASYIDCIPFFVNRLRSVIIENLDFAKIINLYDSPNTLFYVDPPYLDEVCSRNVVIYAHPLPRERHVELADLLNSAKGNVVLSGYQSDLYNGEYPGWFTAAKTAVAGSGAKRTEVIWIKRQEMKLF